METNLIALFERIKTEIIMDGLICYNEPKIEPIAFGMKNLRCRSIVEDIKVSIDDIYEKILTWDDIV